MTNIKTCTFIFVLFAALPLFAADSPSRSKGISMHMLPKRVADLSNTQGHPLKWGFIVSYADYLKPEPVETVLQTADEVLAFVHKQDQSVQDNGVWIVVTNPAAYSDAEKDLLEQVKAMCHKEKIVLFIARGSQLPDGWVRY